MITFNLHMYESDCGSFLIIKNCRVAYGLSASVPPSIGALLSPMYNNRVMYSVCPAPLSANNNTVMRDCEMRVGNVTGYSDPFHCPFMVSYWGGGGSRGLP